MAPGAPVRFVRKERETKTARPRIMGPKTLLIYDVPIDREDLKEHP